MSYLRSLPLCVLAGALLNFGVSVAQTAPAITPAKRIISKIDDNELIALNGNTHPAANARNDRGAVSPDLPMTDLILVLSRSAEQQAAFDAFVAGQNDPGSPNYHQWLTPDEVGQQFGPSLTDIATITNWLASHGLTVTQVTRDRMSIRFNGTARQVTSTFHTQIHNLVVNGKSHIGNMSDPQIPAALAPVVVGIKSLHNFFPHPLHRVGQSVTHDAQTGRWVRQLNAVPVSQSASTTNGGIQAQISGVAKPQFGITGTSSGSQYQVEDVWPWDFATIYNVAPLWNAGIDGTGQTIAIAGTSAIDAGESSSVAAGASGANDVATFRSFFNLPTSNSYNTPIQISGNSQPLTVCTSTSSTALCGIGDLEENTLDVEWSGAVAKNAQIILVASYPASASDDNLYDSESYIVDHLTSRIMNVSYGACELELGTAGNVQYYNLWETAQAEGIAVFVASGDAGSAACDQGGDNSGNNLPYAAEFGQSVNGLASTPWDTAVGGTDFNWCSVTSSDNCVSEAATYWNTSNNSTNQSSAKGYVPEIPWNDSCAGPLGAPFLQSFFQKNPYIGINGVTYSVTDAETGCNAIVYFGVNGALQQAGYSVLLNLVDTVGGGGGASGCVVNDGQDVSSCSSSINSTGSSYGSIPLANDGWTKPYWQTGVAGIPNDKVRDLPDVSFFASDGFLSSSAYLICVSAAANCTYSATTEPTLEVGGTSVATPAMAGVMALINQKAGAPQGNPNVQLYSLANNHQCSAEGGTTGASCYFNDIDKGTNAMACDYSYNTHTPSPNCSLAHAGDYVGILPGYNAGTGYDLATGLGSLNVANVVNAWTAVAVKATPTVTVTPASAAINSNTSLNVTVSVAGSGATPTGTIMLSGGGYTSDAETIGSSPCTSASNCVFTIPASLLSGSSTGQVDTLTATYSGDSNYSGASGTSQVTVTAVAASGSFALSNSGAITFKAGATTGNTSTITVTPSGGFTGRVSLKCSVSPNASSDPASCALSTYSASITGSSPQTAVLTISTTAAAALNKPINLIWPSTGGAVLALLFFVPKRRRNWIGMLGLLILFASGFATACGGGSGSSSGSGSNSNGSGSGSGTGASSTSNPGTTAGAYTVIVTGTVGSTNQTTAVSFTVQ